MQVCTLVFVYRACLIYIGALISRFLVLFNHLFHPFQLFLYTFIIREGEEQIGYNLFGRIS